MTDYASVFRYPDAPYEPDVEEAVRGLEIAEKLCAEVSLRVESRGGTETKEAANQPDLPV